MKRKIEAARGRARRDGRLGQCWCPRMFADKETKGMRGRERIKRDKGRECYEVKENMYVRTKDAGEMWTYKPTASQVHASRTGLRGIEPDQGQHRHVGR